MTRYRRHHQRVNVLDVRALLPSGRGDRSEVRLRDFSASGLFLETGATLPVGAVTELDLTAPGCRDLHIEARVVRVEIDADESSPTGMAVEVVRTEGVEAFVLLDLVERHQRARTGREEPSEQPDGVSARDDGASGEDSSPGRVASSDREAAREPVSSADPRERRQPQAFSAGDSDAQSLDEPETGDETDQLTLERQARQHAEAECRQLRAQLRQALADAERADELEGRVRALRRELLDLRRQLSAGTGHAPSAGATKSWLPAEPAPAAPTSAASARTAEQALVAGNRSIDDEALDEPRPARQPRSQRIQTELLTLGPDTVRSLKDFHRRLSVGAHIVATDRLETAQPINRMDIQLCDWLRTSENLSQALEKAEGRLDEDGLVRATYRFFERGLVRITR